MFSHSAGVLPGHGKERGRAAGSCGCEFWRCALGIGRSGPWGPVNRGHIPLSAWQPPRAEQPNGAVRELLSPRDDEKQTEYVSIVFYTARDV